MLYDIALYKSNVEIDIDMYGKMLTVGGTHLVLSGVGVDAGYELVVDVESVSLFQSVSGNGRSAVALRSLPDDRHVVLPDVCHVQVVRLRRLHCNDNEVTV